jgi:hypothetical protein
MIWFSLIESIPLCIKLSVYLHNPSNTTKENTLSCLRLHVSTSGRHRQAFIRARKLKITVAECTWDLCVTSVRTD